MSNRRRDGGGRSFYNSGPVNPWQGGNVPGSYGGGGIGGDMLSHLSEPQAQLALALSKLLQPPSQSVPSLLTMNTMNPMGNGGGSGGGYRPMGYSSRNRDMNMNRRSRPDFKRDSYNKMSNRSSRNSNKPRRSTSSRKSSERKVQTKSNKSSSPASADKTKSSEKSNDEEVKEETISADDTGDVTMKSVDESELEDKKRDWKEEKSTEGDDGEDKEKKKEGTDDDDGDDNDDDNDDDDDRKPYRGRYSGIHKSLLQCYICDKKMWDGESFEKHMNGRAHQQMFDKVEESYRIKSDMMREAIRLAEERNNIELDRMKRLGKKMKTQQLNHCAMCDLEFYGQLFVHRKSPGHVKLKYFLHPRCMACNKEFPNRMEWESHRLSPEHLRKKTDDLGKRKEKDDKEENIVVEDDNSFGVLEAIINYGNEPDDPEALLDIPENLTEIQGNIPPYKRNRPVGVSFIAPITGFYCKPCTRFFTTEEASQLHAKSRMHYNTFVNILQEKLTEIDEEKKRKGEQEDEDNDGNWKRKKLSKDDNGTESENKDKDEIKEEDKKVKTEDVGDEMYDPFSTNDPNDVCVNDISADSASNSKIDEVWVDVDKDIDAILESSTPVKEEEIPEVKQNATIVPAPETATVASSQKRVTRSKKN